MVIHVFMKEFVVIGGKCVNVYVSVRLLIYQRALVMRRRLN